MVYRLFLAACTAALAAGVVRADPALSRFTFNETHMGTEFQIILYAPDEETALKAGMRLDLGGIAKGYAADEGLAVLKKAGVTRALVAAGGDIAVSGPPPNADGWKIAIAPLKEDDASEGPTLLLHDAAVSTSGD